MAMTMRDFLRTQCVNMLRFEQNLERLHSEVIKNAKDERVADIMRWHMKQLTEQINNMSGIVETLGGKSSSEADPIIQGLTQELQTFLRSQPPQQIIDVYLMQLAQRISSEKIALYRGINELAHLVNERSVIQKLARNQADEERMLSRMNDARRSVITQLSISQLKAA